jgi:hypothetical protein
MLCKFGIHSYTIATEYKPSIFADIVTEYSVVKSCTNCGKIKFSEKYLWNIDKQVFELDGNTRHTATIDHILYIHAWAY